MKLSAMLLSAFTVVFFMNCGQHAEFTNDEQFKSLADGETVEVVPNDEFSVITNDGDSGIVSNDGDNGGLGTGDGGTNNNDGGLSSNDDDDDQYAGTGNNGQRDGNGNNGNKDENGGKGSNNGHRSCHDRLIDQDNKKQHADMVTSPEEMETDKDMFDATKCGNKGKKVLVCHFPNADYSKRKTLCIGRPALEAHLAHLGAQRGTEHVDYAGRCKDNDGNFAEGEHKLRGEDEEKTETASFDFSGLAN